MQKHPQLLSYAAATTLVAHAVLSPARLLPRSGLATARPRAYAALESQPASASTLPASTHVSATKVRPKRLALMRVTAPAELSVTARLPRVHVSERPLTALVVPTQLRATFERPSPVSRSGSLPSCDGLNRQTGQEPALRSHPLALATSISGFVLLPSTVDYSCGHSAYSCSSAKGSHPHDDH